jgi:hypothetical protein
VLTAYELGANSYFDKVFDGVPGENPRSAWIKGFATLVGT